MLIFFWSVILRAAISIYYCLSFFIYFFCSPYFCLVLSLSLPHVFQVGGLQLEGCSYDGVCLCENQHNSPSVSSVPTCYMAWVLQVCVCLSSSLLLILQRKFVYHIFRTISRTFIKIDLMVLLLVSRCDLHINTQLFRSYTEDEK